MKRLPPPMRRRPPVIPGLSGAPRRKRGLSEEGRALWDSVAKQIKPLRKKSRALKIQVAAPAAELEIATKPAPMSRPAASLRIAPAPKPQAPPLAPLGRRERAQLSRGRKEIDARIDLHGMTQTPAHRALFGFLQRAQGAGLTFVLVITAKCNAGA